MNLDYVQREQLSKILMDAFPSYESLKRMVSYKLDTNLDEFANSRKLADCVFELIEHMRSHGRLEDLVLGAYQENPGNQQLCAFAQDHHLITSDLTLSLPRLDLPAFSEDDIPTIPMSSPAYPKPIILDRTLRTLLISALLNTPLATNFEGRSQLLSGVPGAMTLDRVEGNARLDLERIVDQLCLRGIASNQQMPLLILVDNVLPYIEGYEIGDVLQRTRSELANYYRTP